MPFDDRIIDPAGEKLVAAEDPEGAGGESSVGGVEGELPFGVFGTGGVVAAGAREHPGEVLVGVDGGEVEAFEAGGCHER